MSRIAQGLTVVALVAALAGCGGASPSSSSSSASTAAPATSGTPTPPPSTVTVTDVHGVLVRAPGVAGGAHLAFRADGASEAQEITDPAALTAAGARPGRTLIVSGTVDTNTRGATALGETIAVAAFTLDEVALTATLQAQPSGQLLLVDLAGATYQPIGAQAAALLATPTGAPVRVTGRIDPAHAGAATGLLVTSWRETAVLELRVRGGLTGLDERFTIDDLAGTGAYRYAYSMVVFPQDDRRGQGFLPAGERADLARLTAAADLPAQPKVFAPPAGMVIMDVPTTTLRLLDRSGETEVQVLAGSKPPAAVTALVAALRAARQVATTQVLDAGSFSRIGQAGVQVAADDAALVALWTQHTGGGPGMTVPTVDFTKERVVAVFMGRQPTAGYGIAVERLVRVGDEVHLDIARTQPAPGTITAQVITSPFQIVTVALDGASDLYVDGVRR